MQKKFVLLFPLLWVSAGTVVVRAGTVITTNLPAGVSIVNIDATEDGAAGYRDGITGQALWQDPFNTQGTLLTLPVSPGTYTFDIVDPADASAEFPSLTQPQLNSMYTAWTFNSPWVTQYFVFDISAATDPTESQLFDGAGGTVEYGNAPDAYAAAVAGGYTNQLRLTSEQSPTTPGREGDVFETSYTVTAPTSLVFVIPDYALGDNAGGVSVVVTAVPEPKTDALLLGFGGLVWCWHQARRGSREMA